MNPDQFTWDTSGADVTLDLRLSCSQDDGTATIHNLKDNSQRQEFESIDDAKNYLGDIMQHGYEGGGQQT